MYIECAIDVQIKHNIDTFPDSLGSGHRRFIRVWEGDTVGISRQRIANKRSHVHKAHIAT